MGRILSSFLNRTRTRKRNNTRGTTSTGPTASQLNGQKNKKKMEYITQAQDAISAALNSMFGPCFARVLVVNNRRLAVVRELGEGGFSFVYLTRDKRTGELLAVKQLRAQSNEQSKLVRREIRVQQDLQHPNLLPLLDHAAAQTPRYEEILLVFPAYQRGTVYDVVRERHLRGQQQFSTDQALNMFAGIVAGVNAMHMNQPPYAHRDLKPHNVLLDDADRPILMDFGSTVAARQRVANRSEGLAIQEEAEHNSSMAYRAPELWDVQTGTKITEKTDVWSLGCLLFSMFFNGYSPFECQFDSNGEAYGVADVGFLRVIQPVAFPSNCMVEDRICDLIRSMLQVDPNNRPSAADLMARDLASYLPIHETSSTNIPPVASSAVFAPSSAAAEGAGVRESELQIKIA